VTLIPEQRDELNNLRRRVDQLEERTGEAETTARETADTANKAAIAAPARAPERTVTYGQDRI
jgi:hypothetical protein